MRAHSSRKGDGGGSGPAAATARMVSGGSSRVAGAAAAPTPALSPRFLSAESRLAQEKIWLADGLPQHCHADPIRGSDFVWSFKVAGLHRTLYQVCGVGGGGG